MPFTFAPMPHEEARQRIAGMPAVSREVFDGLLPELKAYAFTITGINDFDQLARIRDELLAVPAGTKTWAEVKKTVAADLSERLGGKEAERRAELLLRTHTFRAYAVARYRSLMEQIDVFPYWQYKTHGDGHVRPSHAALNGKILPAGHPIWQKIFPPWDWGCRCMIVPMSAREVGRLAEADEGKAPEAKRVWDVQMADAIHAGNRLPNGMSILPSSTWSAAPWSQPGTVQHTWDLVKARYGHDPKVLKAFESWADKTQISKGLSVNDWLNGRQPAKSQEPTPAKKPEASPEPAKPPVAAPAVKPPPAPVPTPEVLKEPVQPQGEPMTGKLDASALEPAEQKRMDTVTAAIDAVHGVEAVPVIPVDNTVTPGHASEFERTPAPFKPLRIGYDPQQQPELSVVHEIGHVLDCHAIPTGPESKIGPRDHYATDKEIQPGGRMAGWWQTVTKSQAWQDMHNAELGPKLGYFARAREVWSRAYAQFIAEESGDKALKKQIAEVRRSGQPWEQWSAKDFAPIRTAMRVLFRALGWITPSGRNKD